MSWNDTIDNYCERTDPSIFSEPLNLISNIAFLVAAFALSKQIRPEKNSTSLPGSVCLIVLIASIGLGSALFHSIATFGTMVADVVPISLFLFTYLWLYFRYKLKFCPLKSIGGLGTFILLTAISSQIISKEASNGSHLYIGAWIMLLGISCHSFVTDKGLKMKTNWSYPSAFVLFSTSLYFRTIDAKICDEFPNGSHFAWHLLNAAVLYILTYDYLITPIVQAEDPQF